MFQVGDVVLPQVYLVIILYGIVSLGGFLFAISPPGGHVAMFFLQSQFGEFMASKGDVSMYAFYFRRCGMINISNVSFNYKSQDENGLRDVSLHVKQGECVLLCGVSGCGKMTITSPNVLVLDEPSSNLDKSSIKELSRFIRNAKASFKNLHKNSHY